MFLVMASKSTGEIDKHSSKVAFVIWKIPNFFSFPQIVGTYIESPSFFLPDGEWRFKIYPNGIEIHHNHAGLYVKRANAAGEVSLDSLYIGILSGETSIIKTSADFIKKGLLGCPKFIKKTELFRRKEEMAPLGTLQIYCIAEKSLETSDAACQMELINCVDRLSRDFQTLLHNGQKSDVTIQVEDQTFHAHRLILGARSSVFAAMFEHDMREKITGVIDIEDCEPDAFRNFLEFMYTGKGEDLSMGNVADHFSLADKYNVCDLRQICVDFMKENLCLETACRILYVTDRHNEEGLKNLAREFIMKNIKKITSHQNWLSFMRKNPVLGTEILMSLVPEENTS